MEEQPLCLKRQTQTLVKKAMLNILTGKAYLQWNCKTTCCHVMFMQ